MIYFEAGDRRVGVTFASLFWFTVLTTVGTLIGAVAYNYIQSYLPALPDTPNSLVYKVRRGITNAL